jgi:hypothetical protein
MKIVSEQQLDYIKNEFKDLLRERTSKYVFEGEDNSIFENLILFTDDTLFDKIRNEHYLSMNYCQRVWNEYFWYLRYNDSLLKIGINTENHQQPISKILEKLYNSCEHINDNHVELFINFASNFDNQEYILFDYFHPTIIDTGLSISSTELADIIKLLEIQNFNFSEIDHLIEQNIDNKNAELLTFKSKNDPNTILRIDTFSASEDQIHPIDILIKCKFEHKEKIDNLLLNWWTKYWRKMGPFVAISVIDKFDNEQYFGGRKLCDK